MACSEGCAELVGERSEALGTCSAELVRIGPSGDGSSKGHAIGAVAELGGTGRAHDWDISRRLVAASPVPVLLAGGLKPDNAAAAIETVRPFGLDVCSGVRTDGALDATKLTALVVATGR